MRGGAENCQESAWECHSERSAQRTPSCHSERSAQREDEE
jgi:hypothetical protein